MNRNPAGLSSVPGGSVFGANFHLGDPACEYGCGSVYQVQPPSTAGGSWSTTQIFRFRGDGEGEEPNSTLVGDGSGVLYGVVGGAGAHNFGAVFSLTPPVAPEVNWSEQVLYSFRAGLDGDYPAAGLTIGAGGTLYGTTALGGGTGCGGNGCGTVFSLAPPIEPGGKWTEQVLHAFQAGADGYEPEASGSNLVAGSGGLLYGFSTLGGTPGFGILFQLTPPAGGVGPWNETILHTFAGGADGERPESAPTIDANGVLYGFVGGGAGTPCQGNGCGVVYQYVP